MSIGEFIGITITIVLIMLVLTWNEFKQQRQITWIKVRLEKLEAAIEELRAR